MMFLDKNRKMDNVQKHNICTKFQLKNLKIRHRKRTYEYIGGYIQVK
jgi:hypothetical protein